MYVYFVMETMRLQNVEKYQIQKLAKKIYVKTKFILFVFRQNIIRPSARLHTAAKNVRVTITLVFV